MLWRPGLGSVVIWVGLGLAAWLWVYGMWALIAGL